MFKLGVGEAVGVGVRLGFACLVKGHGLSRIVPLELAPHVAKHVRHAVVDGGHGVAVGKG